MYAFEAVKRDLDASLHPGYRPSYHNQEKPVVHITASTLITLLEEYEKMDAELRSLHSANPDISEPAGKRLFDNIMACYFNCGKNFEQTFLVIMDALYPLLQDKIKSDIVRQHAPFNSPYPPGRSI
jgi:hypothetical protein